MNRSNPPSVGAAVGISLVACMLSCIGSVPGRADPPAVSPDRTDYPPAFGAISLYAIPHKRVITSDRAAHSGIYIPGSETRAITFRYLSPEPILISDVQVVDDAGRPTSEVPVLKTVGTVMLTSGLVLGEECPEHLRVGDSVAHGALRNAGTGRLSVEFSNGLRVVLEPGEGIYVGDDYYAVTIIHPTRGSLATGKSPISATHVAECRCTCKCSDARKQVFSTSCEELCFKPGNQCAGMNGDECQISGKNGQDKGHVESCVETLVPIEPKSPQL